METLPADLVALLAVVFALGLRHGLDADHLAAVDGLVRANGAADPRLARWTGTWFSVGHGAVVTAVAVAVGLASEQWIVPGWVDRFGTGFSIAVLCLLGGLNLHAILTAAPQETVRPLGLRSSLLLRLTTARHPLGVAALGALFALSFDTLTLTTTFSVAASGLGGWEMAAALGLLFMAGMAITDGVNGFWVARLVNRADRRARVVSRFVGLVIVKVTFLVAFGALLGLAIPAAATWIDRHALWLGLAIPVLILASFHLANRLVDGPASRAAT
ncbi:MAG: nickel transporter [Gammaproteobacteria bacterium]|nr:nickel transporter [Gammaproteobacteria bacterium]